MAWADGKSIQYRVILNDGLRSQWVTLDEIPFDKKYPNFDAENVEWRVKPEVTIRKYRVALFSHRDGFLYTKTEDHYENFENSIGFVKYLTNWVDYEVEV